MLPEKEEEGGTSHRSQRSSQAPLSAKNAENDN